MLQALSYYDYCFPEGAEEQQRLEEVRHAAQCNLSLCLRQMGFGKEAVEMASQVSHIETLILLPIDLKLWSFLYNCTTGCQRQSGQTPSFPTTDCGQGVLSPRTGLPST
jgi:hypothetical protein